MSEQIREQISAFLDGELPSAESELLMRRLLRDTQLRDSFGRYALIGEAMRGSRHVSLSRDFTGAVNIAIDGGPAGPAPLVAAAAAPGRRWWRPMAGAAVAASEDCNASASFLDGKAFGSPSSQLCRPPKGSCSSE